MMMGFVLSESLIVMLKYELNFKCIEYKQQQVSFILFNFKSLSKEAYDIINQKLTKSETLSLLPSFFLVLR